MSADRRITKKQMKEDKLVTTAFKASEYIQKNPTPFLVGGVAVGVIFVVVILMLWSADRKRNEAEALLARAYVEFDTGQPEMAVDDLISLTEKYSGTDYAPRGCFTLATYYYNQKEYTTALNYYNKIISLYDEDDLVLASAFAGAAACHEIEGDHMEAGRLYSQAAAINPDRLWAPDYLFRAGLNFLAAGDTVQARTAYAKIDSSYDRTMQASRARKYLAEISG
jgi:tetratricopeptide (TPR) repeat protein